MSDVRPVAGPLFKAAARANAGGRKRQRLLCLLAAYADAGEPSPSSNTLKATLGLSVRAFDRLLGKLERDGLVTVERGDQGRTSATATDHPRRRAEGRVSAPLTAPSSGCAGTASRVLRAS